MKYYLVSISTGLIVFLLLPLGITEIMPGTYGSMDIPRVSINFYPAFISIWKQYESAGLLPPSVWDFNMINLFVNVVISFFVTIFTFKKMKPKVR